MRRALLLTPVILLCLPSLLLAQQPAPPSKAAPGNAAALIAKATSAAPASVSANAAVVIFPDKPGEQPVQLRTGSNGWTCFPRDPGGGDAPVCADANFGKFGEAYTQKAKPDLTGLGFAYMLVPGKPGAAHGETEDEGPPVAHVMIAVPDVSMLKGLPTSPKDGGPWVMWSGTDYAHLMLPVADAGAATQGHHR